MNLRTYLPVLATALAAIPLLGSFARADTAPKVTGPVAHENMAVYFVRGASAPGPVPQTLQEALAKGTVEVLETGNVQELKIENRGAEPVFVQAGDIVKGGRQDRVLTVSLLLQPGSGPVPVGSFCVEQGRWAARGGEDAKRFALSESLMPSREAKIAIARRYAATPPPAEAATSPQTAGTADDGIARQQRLLRSPPRSNGQGEVWRSVSKVQEQLTAALAAPVASDKSETSLQLSLENKRLKEAKTALTSAIEPAGLAGDDIVGVVIAVNGRISSADVYPSNALFRKMWPKLAEAAAVEALASKPASATADGTKAEPPKPEEVGQFLAEAETGGEQRRDLGNVGSVMAKDSAKALRVEAVSGGGTLVHRNYVAK